VLIFTSKLWLKSHASEIVTCFWWKNAALVLAGRPDFWSSQLDRAKADRTTKNARNAQLQATA